jgi:hypothetical protein
MSTQRGIFEKSSEESFERFNDANPRVYYLLREMALRLRRAGWKHYSIRTLWEALRWRRDVEKLPEEGYKLNDHYPPFYARRLMAMEPELAGFFEIRERRK